MATNEQRAAARKVATKKKADDLAKQGHEIIAKAQRDAEGLEITEASAWKKGGVHPVKLMLPSGNVCLARNPGLPMFIQEGLIPNNLLPIVQRAVSEGKGMTPKDQESFLTDTTALGEILLFADKVLVRCVVKPEVTMQPADGEPREEGKLYADEVDMDDKMFILQWAVGGTSDVERFRIEQATAVATVDAGEQMARKT